jgi:hypothetical protein
MSKSYSKASMKVREIELKMNRNLMAVGCNVRTCVLSVYYIDTVYNKGCYGWLPHYSCSLYILRKDIAIKGS